MYRDRAHRVASRRRKPLFESLRVFGERAGAFRKALREPLVQRVSMRLEMFVRPLMGLREKIGEMRARAVEHFLDVRHMLGNA